MFWLVVTQSFYMVTAALPPDCPKRVAEVDNRRARKIQKNVGLPVKLVSGQEQRRQQKTLCCTQQ